MIEVTFFELENDEDNAIGTLVFDGSKYLWKNLKKDYLHEVLDDSLYVNDKFITSKKDPEAFMKSLHIAYNSIQLRASKAKYA